MGSCRLVATCPSMPEPSALTWVGLLSGEGSGWHAPPNTTARSVTAWRYRRWCMADTEDGWNWSVRVPRVRPTQSPPAAWQAEQGSWAVAGSNRWPVCVVGRLRADCCFALNREWTCTPREIRAWGPGDAVYFQLSSWCFAWPWQRAPPLCRVFVCAERGRAWCGSSCWTPNAGLTGTCDTLLQGRSSVNKQLFCLPYSATNVITTEIFVSNITAKGSFWSSDVS